jgi:hypothetical protein
MSKSGVGPLEDWFIVCRNLPSLLNHFPDQEGKDVDDSCRQHLLLTVLAGKAASSLSNRDCRRCVVTSAALYDCIYRERGCNRLYNA